MNFAAPRHIARATAQRGRTLIELMVAIALGLVILLGVGTLYLTANQSTRSAVNVASAEETGQVALALIGNAIRRAGYAEIIGTSIAGSRNNLLYSGPAVRGCTNNPFTAVETGTCATTNTTQDTLAVWFQADTVVAAAQSATEDCLGSAAPNSAVTDATFQLRAANLPLVRNEYYIESGDLVCRGNGSANPLVLLNGVEEFKVYFGFDTDSYTNPGAPSERPTARRILSAQQIIDDFPDPSPDVSRWDFVVSVHVCVLVRTQEAGVAVQGSTTAYERCPKTAAQAQRAEAVATGTATDGAVRRAYSQVFSVRARSTASPAT